MINRARVLAYVMMSDAYELLAAQEGRFESHDPDCRRYSDAIDMLWETMLNDEEQEAANEIVGADTSK
jgi:hypothetical protein